MKTLIIIAHPSSLGFTRRIAQTYSKIKKELGFEVQIMDLYAEENRQGYLEFEKIKELEIDAGVKRIQEIIKESDELIFIFPLWWYGEPAIMKNFWDKNFSSGFAYKYIDGRPRGLLRGKTARVFLTSDGPAFYQWLLLNPLWTIWKITRLGFCGIKMRSFTVFGSMRTRNEESRMKLLKKVEKIARKK